MKIMFNSGQSLELSGVDEATQKNMIKAIASRDVEVITDTERSIAVNMMDVSYIITDNGIRLTVDEV